MRLKIWILMPALLLALTACGGLVEPAATQTPAAVTETNVLYTATPQLTPTPRILFSSLTPEVTEPPTSPPTLTPNPFPTQQTFVREGTPMPPSEPITSANAGQLVELARLGKGAIVDVQLSPDRNFLLVQTTIGVYGWLADSQLEVWGFEDPTGIAAIALPQLERWMAVATNDGQIALLIYQRGSMFTRWDSGHNELYDLSFSLDDEMLAAVGDQGVTVWEVGATEPLYHYPDILGTAIRFTPDGEGLIIRGSENTTNYYSLISGEGLTVAGTGDFGVWEFSRDGSYLSDGENVWNGTTGDFLYAIDRADGVDEAVDLAFSYDSRYIAINAFNDELIHILRTSDGEEVFSLRSPYFSAGLTSVNSGEAAMPSNQSRGFIPYYTDLAFSPDGNNLAAATSNESVEIWNLETGEFEERIPSLGNMLLFRKASRLVVWGYNSLEQVDPVRGGSVYLDRDFNSLRYDNFFVNDPIAERAVIFSEDGEWVIAENVVWHLPDGVRTYRLGGETALAADMNGEYVYTFDYLTDTVRKRRVGNFAVVDEVELLSPSGLAENSDYYHMNLVVSHVGRFASGYVEDYGLVTWDLVSGEPIEELYSSSTTYGGAFSPDTEHLYVWGDDGLIIYRLDTYQQDFTRGGSFTGYREVLNFTMDGRYLLINQDGIDGYWVYTDHLEKVLHIDQHGNLLAISPDNSVIAIDVNTQLLLLDLDTGVELWRIPASLGSIIDITFSPDGRYIATSSWDGTVRIWGIPPQD